VSVHVENKVAGRVARHQTEIMVGDEWRFARLPVALPLDTTTIAVSISLAEPVAGGVLVDQVVMATGTYDGAPERATGGAALTWDGQPVTNTVTNPTFEDAPLWPRPWLAGLVKSTTGRDVRQLLDLERHRAGLPDSGEEWQREIGEPFLESLWGRLGRVVDLNMPSWWYATHTALLAAAVVGAAVALGRAIWRRRVRGVHVAIGALLLPTAALTALTALGPYVVGLFDGPPFGRYFLVALLPLAGLYVGGLVWVWPRPLRGIAVLLLLLVLAALDAYVLFYALPTHYSINPP
jgi:hypothetical protein